MPIDLILFLQYEITAYLYIEYKITGFSKLTDVGVDGEFSTQKMDRFGWKWGFFLQKYEHGWIWIWPNGVE